jgi:hypothetical protein
MMDGTGIVRIAYTHRTDRNSNPCSQIAEKTEKDRRQCYTHGDPDRAIQIMAVDETFILPYVIHCRT